MLEEAPDRWRFDITRAAAFGGADGMAQKPVADTALPEPLRHPQAHDAKPGGSKPPYLVGADFGVAEIGDSGPLGVRPGPWQRRVQRSMYAQPA